MSEALRHFVEQALGTRLADFDDWFPPVFDWRALCADVPAMVQTASQGWIDADDASISETLRRRAQDFFRHGHLVGLAVLVAKTADENDPDGLLARLTAAPPESQEQVIGRLARTQLGPVEAALGGADGALDDEGTALETLFLFTWTDVENLLGLEDPEEGEDGFEALAVARPVLIGVARIGVLLAGIRWMASGGPQPD